MTHKKASSSPTVVGGGSIEQKRWIPGQRPPRMTFKLLFLLSALCCLLCPKLEAADITWTDQAPTSLWPKQVGWLVIPYDPVSQQTFIHIGPPSGSQGIYSTDFYFYKAGNNTFTHIGGTGSAADGCPADTPTLPGDRHPEHILTDTKRNFIWLFGGVNVFCGIGSVTTNGTAVTWAASTPPLVSAPFTTDGTLLNQTITINGAPYTIASVQDGQHLTLTTSAGVQSSPVIYSLSTGSGTNPRRDMYYLTLKADPTQDVWTEVFPAHIPDAYNYSGVQYDPDDDVIFLYGGTSGGFGSNWVYCSTLQGTPGVLTAKQSAAGCASPDDWTQVIPVGGIQPLGVYHNGMLYDTQTKKMILYGGTSGALTTAYGQTWAYDVPTHTWTQKCAAGCTAPPDFKNSVLTAGSSVPKPSWAYSTSTHKIYLHQDGNYSDTQPSDWVYDPSADTWTPLISAGVGPSLDSFMAYDAGTDRLITMGQTSANLLDMWQSSLSATCSVAPSLLPAGSVGTAYSQILTAANCGSGPFNWTITSGSLPPGLSGCNGVSGPSCTITGTPTTTSGSPFSFTVQATDGGSNTTTQSYSLTVNPPVTVPVITLQPVNASANPNTSTNFSVTASGTGLSYQWQLQPAGASSFSPIAGATGSSYATPILALSDNGNQYKVIVTNSAGSTPSNAATLTVTANAIAPSIIQQPQDQPKSVGDNATFTIVVNGSLPITYQWQYQYLGNWITVGPNSASYTLTNVQLSQSGLQYRCVVTNGAGSITSAIATLTVNTGSGGGPNPPTNPTPVTYQAPDLSQVKVYPNPWRKDKHASHPSITFANLPIGTTVKLFTVSGHKVKAIGETGGQVSWDLTNDSGDKVASGIYVYLITIGDTGYGGSAQKLKGKVAVIK